MTSHPLSAVRCDVIRSSFRANDVVSHGDVIINSSCSISSSSSRRRAIPWHHFGPAMKRRKALLTPPGQDMTSPSDDVFDNDQHHGFVFNPVSSSIRSPMTSSSSSSRERWSSAAASSASVGGLGADPYPTNGVCTPPVSCRTSSARSGSSFRRSKSGGSGESTPAITVQPKSSGRSMSSTPTTNNHRGSVRFSSFRKSDKSESGTGSGGAKKGPKRNGSWIFRSLFGRQDDSRSSSSGASDLWVDVPLWMPAEESVVIDAGVNSKSLVGLHEVTGSTCDAEPVLYGRRFAVDLIESPRPIGKPHLGVVDANCSRHRSDVTTGDLAILRRTKSRRSARGVRFCETTTKTPEIRPPTNDAVDMELECETKISHVSQRSCSLPSSLCLPAAGADDSMELDLSAFDAVIASLRDSTDGGGGYGGSVGGALQKTENASEQRRTEKNEFVIGSTSATVPPSGDRSVDSVGGGMVQPTRTTSKDVTRQKPALLPKPSYLASRSFDPSRKGLTSGSASAVDQSDPFQRSSSQRRTVNSSASENSSFQQPIPVSSGQSREWRETDLSLSLPMINTNPTAVHHSFTASETELPVTGCDGQLATTMAVTDAQRRKKKYEARSSACQNFADENTETVRRNVAKVRHGNEFTVSAVIETRDWTDSVGDIDVGSLPRRTSTPSDVPSTAQSRQIANFVQISEEVDEADKNKSADKSTTAMTTEQWLDSLHRKKKHRAVAPVGLTDAERLSVLAKYADRTSTNSDCLPVPLLPVPPNDGSHDSMYANGAGDAFHSVKQPSVGTTCRAGVCDRMTSLPDSVMITIDNEDASSITSDITRLPSGRRRPGAPSTKQTSFLSRFRRAMVSGFESLIGRSAAADGSSKSQVSLAAAATSGIDPSNSCTGSSSSISEPLNRTAACSRWSSGSGIISQADYDRMTELEKLSLLAEKMALEKQKSLADSDRLLPQHFTEHLRLPKSSHDALTHSASSTDADAMTLSSGAVQRSKSCHNVRGGNAGTTSKFLMTPTVAIDFDDMIARFASVRVADNDHLSGTASPQSARNSAIVDNSVSSEVAFSAAVHEDDVIRRREPPVRSCHAEVDDHRRISMASSVSLSSSSSGYGSLRRSKTASQSTKTSIYHGSSSSRFVPEDDYRSSNGLLASVTEIPGSLPVSPSHSTGDDQRTMTNRLDDITYISSKHIDARSSNNLPRPAMSAATSSRGVDDVTDETARLLRRRLPANNSFTCDQTTSRSSRSLAVQFFQMQQRRAQMSATDTSTVLEQTSEQVPSDDVMEEVTTARSERLRQRSANEERRRTRDKPKTGPKQPPPRSSSSNNGLASSSADVEELSQITCSLREVSAAIEMELRENDNHSVYHRTDRDARVAEHLTQGGSRLNSDDDSRFENYSDLVSPVSRTTQMKRNSGRTPRSTLTLAASTPSTFGETDFGVGGTLPDWLSTVNFHRRNPVDEDDEADELGSERADDVDQGVDVDTEDDALSTSTLTDNGSIRSTSSCRTTSTDRSGTTLAADSDDYERLSYMRQQRNPTSTNGNGLSNSGILVGSGFSSFESLPQQECQRPPMTMIPRSDLHLPSSPTALFDFVAFGGSLPTSYRRSSTAAAAAASDGLHVAPRAASSLAVGHSSRYGSDAAAERRSGSEDEAELYLTRRMHPSADIKVAPASKSSAVGFDQQSAQVGHVGTSSNNSPSPFSSSTSTRTAARRGPGGGYVSDSGVVHASGVVSPSSLDVVSAGLQLLASSAYDSNSSGIGSWCDGANSPRSLLDSPL